MNIKSAVWTLAHSNKGEDRREWAVLYWKAQGLKNKEIAEKWFYSEDWVQRYMNHAYKRFEVPRNLNKYEKLRLLEETVFPIIREFVHGEPETVRELPPPPVGEPIQPDPAGDPEVDETTDTQENKEKTQPNKPIVIDHPTPIFAKPKPINPIVRILRYAIFIVVACLLFGTVGYMAYLFGSRNQTPTPIVIVVTPTPQDTPIPTLTTNAPVGPVVDSTATIGPSSTPPPTNTVVPSRTPKPYLSQGEGIQFGEGITMYLEDRFTPHGSCGESGADWIVALAVDNRSSSQFLLRFNTGAFSATDDIGTQYQLIGAGIRASRLVGIDESQNVTGFNYICLAFKGAIPLNANYLLITADWVSGVGPTTFRKDL